MQRILLRVHSLKISEQSVYRFFLKTLRAAAFELVECVTRTVVTKFFGQMSMPLLALADFSHCEHHAASFQTNLGRKIINQHD